MLGFIYTDKGVVSNLYLFHSLSILFLLLLLLLSATSLFRHDICRYIPTHLHTELSQKIIFECCFSFALQYVALKSRFKFIIIFYYQFCWNFFC